MIEAKASGDTDYVVATEAPPREKVVDLMAALEASVKDAKEARGRHPTSADAETAPAKKKPAAREAGGEEEVGLAARAGRRDRRPGALGHQPRQGPVPRGRVHQGRGHRLLRPGRPGDAAPRRRAGGSPCGATRTASTAPRSSRSGRPDHRPGLDRHRPGPRRPQGRHPLPASSTRWPRWPGWGTWPGSRSTPRWPGPTTSTPPRWSSSTSTPGRRRGMVDCCRVALEIREVLDDLDLAGLGEDVGLQGPAALPAAQHAPHPRARVVVRPRRRPAAGEAGPEAGHQRDEEGRCARARSSWTGARTRHHKTTIAAYSLRARPTPTVSTPVAWDEVEAGAEGEALASPPPRCWSGWPTSATCSPTPPRWNSSFPGPPR